MTINRGQSTAPARGRPSVAAERRQQIVGAFIELVAEQGSSAVSVAEVAERAGVARPAVRHFVGNRSDLIASALVELVDRYRKLIDAAVGPEPSAPRLVEMLFDDGWVRERPLEDEAFDVLAAESIRNGEARALILGAFTHLVDVLSAAFARSGASRTRQELDSAAYAIVCLSEHNVSLQALGFDPVHSKAAAECAQAIVDTTLSPSPAAKQ